MDSFSNYRRLIKFRSLVFLIPILIVVTGYFSYNKARSLIQYHLGIENIRGITQLGISFKPKAKDVKFQGDGLRLAGTLFLNNNSKPPGIVFLHGSSILGRKQAFCLLLCKRLSEKGYHVLSIDMRGFGESEDPSVLDSAKSWNSRGDISRAIDYLITHTDVDTNQIVIVGHSAGANRAIIAGIEDPHIKKIVAIGPSRRVKERIFSDQSEDRQYFIERFSRDRELSEVLPWDTYRDIAATAMIDAYLPYFQAEGHKPIFLIDGERENPADLEFLQEIYKQMVPRKHYLTIPGSNHYGNTKGFGPLIFYHKEVFGSLVDVIVQWLQN